MARSEAEARAIKKYEKEKIDRILMRVPKGEKEAFRAYAESRGESLNGFLYRAAKEAIERDRG